MITFEPFWDLMKERGITTYDLINTYDFNPVEISRLKHDHNYTLKSIDRYCHLFSCQPGDILSHISMEEIDTKLTP